MNLFSHQKSKPQDQGVKHVGKTWDKSHESRKENLGKTIKTGEKPVNLSKAPKDWENTGQLAGKLNCPRNSQT